jgi:heterodisulfide reductase subunit A-like polyferredoxin
MDQPKIVETDVLVVGAGIAGMQAALDAADQGVRVVLAEKDASIGGRMINLSKVFPTLDCASCITTPRMASVAHHARIETLTHTEVLAVERVGDGFRARLRKKPRYVDEANCIGCRLPFPSRTPFRNTPCSIRKPAPGAVAVPGLARPIASIFCKSRKRSRCARSRSS